MKKIKKQVDELDIIGVAFANLLGKGRCNDAATAAIASMCLVADEIDPRSVDVDTRAEILDILFARTRLTLGEPLEKEPEEDN